MRDASQVIEPVEPEDMDHTGPESAVRRVALFSPGWPPRELPNGIVTLVQQLRPALDDLGCQTYVIAASGSADNDPRVHPVPAQRTLWTRVADRLMPRKLAGAAGIRRQGRAAAELVASLARRPGLDVIEMEESFGWAAQVAAAAAVPVVVRLHGPWFLTGTALGVKGDEAMAWRIAAEGAAIRDAAGVVAASRDVLERTRAHYGLELPDARVIPCPMAATAQDQRWRIERARPNRILFAGRFDRLKGGDIILRAFGHLAQRRPEVELVFAGPDRGFEDEVGRAWSIGAFMREYVPAEVRGRVNFLGQCTREELQAQRREAAVTVACSRYETFGLTVTEAMSQGCPVIATNVGAVPEIVQDGRNGLLCRADDPHDLARKLQVMLDNPRRAAELGEQAAIDCVTRYDPRQIARQSLQMYRDVRARWLSASPAARRSAPGEAPAPAASHVS